MGNKSTISLVSLIVSAATLGLVLYIIIATPGDAQKKDYRIEKNLAGELADNNLYAASIDEYRKILDDPGLDGETRANINYMIAKTYFENLFDYENAAAHYIRARSLNPEAGFYDEAGKSLIACLEKMGRMIDAKRELDKTVNIDSVYAAHEGETVVAKIGQVPVFLSEIDNEIQNLPPEAQKRFLGREGKVAFLNQYVGLELMHRAAVREGFNDDADIISKKQALERQLLIEKYIIENVMPQIDIDTSDVRNYYLAHKEEKYGDKSYDEVSTQVLLDYQQEKAQKAFSDYVARLSAVEKVQMFEENVR
jgi:tetratricopeptide (TPR) repeat protein